MTEPYTTFKVRGVRGSAIHGAIIVIALGMAWFGVRWQLGTMLGELTSPNDPEVKYVSATARKLSPGDPIAAWLYAASDRNFFDPERVESSIENYAEVVRLGPNDYRWWIELGRAEEQADNPKAAEKALQKAVSLAPTYAFPRWQLGNFLLRAGRTDEAFNELRKITENNVTYREQVFSLAWDYFDHDPSRVESLAADSPDVRASLALFYAARAQAADSLRIWNTLSDEQKGENPQIARTIAQALTEKKFFRQGLEFSRQVGIDPDAQPETVTNGGFEKATGNPEDNYYGWNIERSDNKLDISTDSSVKQQGNRSLKFNFRTYVKPELSNPWQIVVVEPGASYTLHFWVRTENLRSAGMPQVEVLDPADNKLIAASPAFNSGTNDWQEFNVEFKAPEASDAVVLRLARGYCGETCPVVGLLWLDGFALSRK